MRTVSFRQHGIALVLVLWIIALLTIIAVSLTTAQQTESILARNQVSAARFRAAADAAVGWTVLNLLAPQSAFDETDDDEADQWLPDGAVRSWSFGEEILQIEVHDEQSRIDLNKAGKDVLAALIEAAGYELKTAETLADAIEDWRDANDLAELNGAEDRDYEDAGLSYGAKDGPFESVEELQLVLGMNREIYYRLLPALTVDAASSRTKQEFAPPLVKAALRGISLEEVLEEEEQAVIDGDPDAPPINRGGPLYRIRITRVRDGEPDLGMEALVRIQGANTPPFSVLWRRFGLVQEYAGARAEEETGVDY